MSYSYSRDREEFFGTVARLGGTYSDARALLRASSALQVISEKECSFEMTEREAARLAKRSEAAEKRAAAIAKSFGAALSSQGDPRGYALTLTKDGREYGVPGRGLPARCFS